LIPQQPDLLNPQFFLAFSFFPCNAAGTAGLLPYQYDQMSRRGFFNAFSHGRAEQ
jgi:hypothetical protein